MSFSPARNTSMSPFGSFCSSSQALIIPVTWSMCSSFWVFWFVGWELSCCGFWVCVVSGLYLISTGYVLPLTSIIGAFLLFVVKCSANFCESMVADVIMIFRSGRFVFSVAR